MSTAFTRMASTSLLAMILLCLAWEMWLAPLRPGGSMLALKVLPLLLPLRGILHGRRYTYQWTSLLVLIYLAEGLVRSITDQGIGQWLAMTEALSATVLFVACLGHARATAPSRAIKAGD
ncbi:MAG: DUF2069 domain-containing protein [Rhodocyclales bacterium]|nr:DUF2069 domain-containing protein [Rhodocyclales bacterium]